MAAGDFAVTSVQLSARLSLYSVTVDIAAENFTQPKVELIAIFITIIAVMRVPV